jgi:hypothetical protein
MPRNQMDRPNTDIAMRRVYTLDEKAGKKDKDKDKKKKKSKKDDD